MLMLMLLENKRCMDGFTKAFTVVVVADAKMNDTVWRLKKISLSWLVDRYRDSMYSVQVLVVSCLFSRVFKKFSKCGTEEHKILHAACLSCVSLRQPSRVDCSLLLTQTSCNLHIHPSSCISFFFRTIVRNLITSERGIINIYFL